MTADRLYCLISPVRNEARFLHRTLDSVAAQSVQPAHWVVVDDGSTDETPYILADYATRLPYLRVVTRPDRGFRKVGGGVIEAFQAGYESIDPAHYAYICKLDMDLHLPPHYFQLLMERMEADPRLGTCSGKAYYPALSNPYGRLDGALISERCGDDTSLGMTKFYRTDCFEAIGGFVPRLMWDGIDCHTCRMKGWKAASWDDPDLHFVHLRPMGSSDKSVFTGRKRHGAGQYYMGTGPLYLLISAVYRAFQRPYLIGGLGIVVGYVGAWAKGIKRYPDPAFRRYLRRYHRLVLRYGKARAVAILEREETETGSATS